MGILIVTVYGWLYHCFGEMVDFGLIHAFEIAADDVALRFYSKGAFEANETAADTAV